MTTLPPRAQVDRRQLQQIIAGLSEGVVLLDAEGRIVWANEAALAAYGAAALGELGETSQDFFQKFNLHYRNRHELTEDKFPMARLLAGEAFADVVVEVTFPTDPEARRRVHSLRGLVLTDAAGQAESLVLVVNDVTERYSAEERFERTFSANPAPAIICAVADLRFRKVNQGFLDMTGYTREAVIGRSVYEIDVLEGAADREGAIERLNQWQTIKQTEASLKLPDGHTKPVIVAGQPIEMGETQCMLFTFMDLEPAKRAEFLLRQSEARFATAFRLAPVPMMLTTFENFTILDVNDAFARTMLVEASSAVGKTVQQIALWPAPERRRAFEQQLREENAVRNFETQLAIAGAGSADFLISADAVDIQAQRCVLLVMLDISERKRSETEIVAAIEAVMKDTSWFSQTVIEKLANIRQPSNGARPNTQLASLTLREREVLELICSGLADTDIAAKLGLSRNTVRNHVATLYGKIGVHRRGAAIVWARERGITGPKS